MAVPLPELTLYHTSCAAPPAQLLVPLCVLAVVVPGVALAGQSA